MGLSHDEKQVKVTTNMVFTSVNNSQLDLPIPEAGNINFFYDLDSIPETGSTSIVRQEARGRINIDRAFS